MTLAEIGKQLVSMGPEEPLWQAGARARGVTSGTVAAHCCTCIAAAGLEPGGPHVLRHTATKLRREAGESLEGTSDLLDHSSLAVTPGYLRRLEGLEDRRWSDVATAIAL